MYHVEQFQKNLDKIARKIRYKVFSFLLDLLLILSRCANKPLYAMTNETVKMVEKGIFHAFAPGCDVWRIARNDPVGFLIFQDYRERWGTKCAGCGEYVEGDVVTAGDKHAFHPNCFHCQRCRQPLLGQGTKVSLVQGACFPSRLLTFC